MGPIYILTRWNHDINFEVGQTTNIPRTQSKHLRLTTVRDFALGTNYIQPKLVFCSQHRSKFLVNNIYKHSLLSLKPLIFVPGRTQFGLLSKSVLLELQFWDPKKMRLFILVLPLLSTGSWSEAKWEPSPFHFPRAPLSWALSVSNAIYHYKIFVCS